MVALPRPVSPLEQSVSQHNDGDDATFLLVTAGKHQGKRVRFVKRTEKRVAVHLLDDNHQEKLIYLLPSHVSTSDRPQHAEENNIMTTTNTASTSATTTTIHPIISSQNGNSTLSATTTSPTWVRVIAGKHKGKTLRFIKRTEKRVAVQLENGTLIYLLPTHVDMINNAVQDGTALPPSSEVALNNLAEGNHQNNSASVATPTLIQETATNAQHPLTRQAAPDADDFITAMDEEECLDFDFVSVNSTGEISSLPSLVPVNVASNNNLSASTRPTSRASDRILLPRNVATAAPDEDDDSDFVSATMGSVGEHDSLSPEAVSEPAPTHQTNSDSIPSTTTFSWVRITGGKHQGKTARFVKRTAQRVAVEIEQGHVVYLLPNNVDMSGDEGPVSSPISHPQHDENDPIANAIRDQMQRDHTGGRGRRSTVVVQNCTKTKVQQTLFGAIFPTAIFVEISNLGTMTNANCSKLAQEVTIGSRTLFLAAIKMHNKEKTITCAYLFADSKTHVRNQLLENVGSLDNLIPRKAASRLELLLSTAAEQSSCQNNQSLHIHKLQPHDFCTIDEKGNDGCGFIPHRMIQQLLQGDDTLDISTHDVSSIQVRIVIPSMGVFKGMLAVKPGIDKIELPPSMKKVDASSTTTIENGHDEVAWLLINQSGIHPYSSRIQQAQNGFEEKRIMPEQAQWMLTQKGVSNTYLNTPNQKHANLIGEADPTNGIPPGCIFMSGISQYMEEFAGVDRVLMSRFPMTEASDGRLLPILKARPPSMSPENWNFLCSKKFGSVIFPQPPPGQPTIPEQTAQSDLDGDKFFVCWDPSIVNDAVIGDRPILATKNKTNRSRNSSSGRQTPDADWWRETLDFMTDLKSRFKSQRLIGVLCNLWKKRLKAGLQQDAILFGRAYKEALVTTKHGGKVTLRTYLWDSLPHELRQYLKAPAEND